MLFGIDKLLHVKLKIAYLADRIALRLFVVVGSDDLVWKPSLRLATCLALSFVAKIAFSQLGLQIFVLVSANTTSVLESGLVLLRATGLKLLKKLAF